MRKEVVTNQQQAAPITSGHTTLTFSNSTAPIKEETYVNKVFQQNEQPAPQKVQWAVFSNKLFVVEELKLWLRRYLIESWNEWNQNLK